MGSLITETPFSEITATLEVLDRHGVGRDHLKKFRAASSGVQGHIALILKTADTCTMISSTNTYTSDNSKPKKLLVSVRSFRAPGAKKFVAMKQFHIRISTDARVRISRLGANFMTNFFEKTEADVAECVLKLKQLRQASLDTPIIMEQGGEKKAEINLCEYYETLAYKQAIRDFSRLVAHIRAVDGGLMAVAAHWGTEGFGGDGWIIEAFPVGNPHGWNAGNEFVSR